MDTPTQPPPAQQPPSPNEKFRHIPTFWEKYSRIIIIAEIAAVLLVGGLAFIHYKNRQAPQQNALLLPSGTIAQSTPPLNRPTPAPRSKFGEIIGNIFWDVPEESLGTTGYKIEPQIKEALSTYQFEELVDTRFVVTAVKGSSLSARFIYAELEQRDDNNVPVPSSKFQLFLKKIGTTWDVRNVKDPEFCPMLKTFPVDVVSIQERVSVYTCP